jgi:hypothetical protein
VVSIENNIDALKQFAINSKSGSFVKVGFRKDLFLNTQIILGRSRDIVFSNNSVQPGFFAIVELDEILASHNEKTFSDTENYPKDSQGKNVNDRNYASDKNAQAKVISVAQNLNPNILVSTSPTASGTPIISVDGIVVSGNNRTMSLKLAENRFSDVYANYVRVLKDEILLGGYGIDLKRLETFNNPILVRFDMGVKEYSAAELNRYNKVRSKSEKPIDVAIRLSRQLTGNEGCKAQLISLISDQETVSELYSDQSSVQRFKKILLDCGIITENEISNLFTSNSLTDSGKILYDTILLSLILNTSAIEISQNNGVKSATRAIVNAIIPLVKNKTFEEGRLVEAVNDALLIQNDMISRGIEDISDYVAQRNLFEENKLVYLQSVVINWYLNQTVNQFKNTLLKYNNSLESNIGGSIFGDALTPDQIFQSIFVDGTNQKIQSIFDKKEKTLEPSVSMSKESLNERINNLTLAMKYQDPESRIEIEKLIKNLQLALKYL